MIDRKGLELCIAEANSLTNKLKMTKQEERRHAFLLSAISVLKTGEATLADLDQDYLNERAAAAGLPVTQFERSTLTSNQKAEARGFQAFVEQRTDVEGGAIARIGTYTGLGYFVPTGWWDRVFESLKQHDPIFDDQYFTQLRTPNGIPTPVPLMDDTENDAAVVSEPGSTSSVDIASPAHAVLGAYSYASRRWQITLESLQDLQGMVSAMELFRKFTSKALARGIGKDLLNGDGVNKPLGLIPALTAAGATVVVAGGSAVNDGGSGTASNSLGTPDFAAAYAKLDAAHLASPSCAWLMNVTTFGKLLGLVDKVGQPVINFVSGAPMILGKPIKLSPGMPDIAASASPVILMNCEYWATRIVTGGVDDMGIQLLRESAGLAENGLVAFRSFCRADGSLLWKSGPSPAVVLQNHS
jgi:HK97 family phage major capsid protein